jgi:hypothetical protein
VVQAVNGVQVEGVGSIDQALRTVGVGETVVLVLRPQYPDLSLPAPALPTPSETSESREERRRLIATARAQLTEAKLEQARLEAEQRQDEKEQQHEEEERQQQQQQQQENRRREHSGGSALPSKPGYRGLPVGPCQRWPTWPRPWRPLWMTRRCHRREEETPASPLQKRPLL